MRLPGFLDGAPRAALGAIVAVIGILAVAGFLLAQPADEDEIARADSVPIATATTTPEASRNVGPNTEVEAAPTPTAVPTVAAVVDRTDCAAIRGTDYRSETERAWFRLNCAGSPTTASAGVSAAPVAAASGGGGIRGSGDRLVVQRLGINAPVNYRTVGGDGQLGDPSGPYDVVWYDFRNWPGYGGYPGDGGNAVVAGHVDYRTVGAAVFYNLRTIAVGDVIQYQRADGQVISYSVSSVSDILPGADWNPIVSRGGGEAITLITCNGTFDAATREYSHRRVVRAVRT